MRLRSEVDEWFGQGAKLPSEGRIHFVGIGGAGMSALARILLTRGREVTGSDIAESASLNLFRERGAKVFIGHSAENVDGAAAVVVSDAIKLSDNSEIAAAREKGLTFIRRSQLLGILLEGYRVLAVTGSHGKSTTSAILAQILVDAGMDPLAIIGADVPGFDGNVRHGRGDFAVVEACEAYDSFHDLKPEMVLLTNLEPEHLDYHITWENLRGSVVKFINSATATPKLIFCGADKGANETASFIRDSKAYASNPALNGEMHIIGKHNALNASGAIAVAEEIGIPASRAIAAAASARGCVRRLERIGEANGITVYDDYAHHPTEIDASLEAIRGAHHNNRIIAVFQPHLYSRTRDQLDEFAPALSAADIAVITDIYPARERPIPGISSALIVERLENMGAQSIYISSRHLLPRSIAAIAKPGDVIVGMGAGNIDSLAPEVLQEINRADDPLRVAVWSGGDSAEREVSILSGDRVVSVLRSRGYQVETFDPAELLLNRGDVSNLKGPGRPDIVFLALHGTGAEDGATQGFLELLHLPYTGSGVLASALTMDKAETKRRLNAKGLPTPKGVEILRGDEIPDFPVPCVVKPNAQGSTIGLTFVTDPGKLGAAVKRALKYDEVALIEEMAQGVEISVPVLGDEVLPVVEIRPKSGIYDFESKYTPDGAEEIVPARISDNATRTAKEYAKLAHEALGARDLSRTDMIVNGDEIVILEVNTLPGLTQTSLLPNSAASIGISYGALCERILTIAMRRYGIEKKK
ncbi:MAG: D-alanine--D-alanine ligase [Armatimonadetes bacterium]|nr:D-alanine--D-alanine ligase [Armatimonadota bacterium]